MRVWQFIIFTVFLNPCYAQSADNTEALIHIEKFLLEHPCRFIDSVYTWDIKGRYHSYEIETIKNDTAHISLYSCGWNIDDVCDNEYVIIIDFLHQTRNAYPKTTFSEDMVGLYKFFKQNTFFKPSTELTCYEYLIGNQEMHEDRHWRRTITHE